MPSMNRGWLWPVLVPFLTLCGLGRIEAAQTPNLMANPSFEMGRAMWRANRGGGTVADFTVERGHAAAGEYSALVTIGTVGSWGVQFGQSLDTGARGKTYTFAALARSVKGPVTADLQIERRGKPYDRAARSKRFTLAEDDWTELHVTFKVAKDFAQGWFAYISCTQANCRFRVDMFRLYEGTYVPFKDLPPAQALPAAVHLFDTGSSSSAPLAGEAVSKRSGWTEVPEGDPSHRFAGDVVFANNRVAVALRRGVSGAEVYSVGRGGARMRAGLVPLAGAETGTLASVKVVENTPNSVLLEASFKSTGRKNLALTYGLRIGQVFVETAPVEGVTALRLEAPSRHVVLPDFFADDIVVDATSLPVEQADLPGENLLLHLLGNGDALATAVWNTSGEDVRITLSGAGEKRQIDASEIVYGTKGKVWLAVTEGAEIWHVADVPEQAASKGRLGPVVSLGWTTPFPAQWRIDWRQPNGLTDSWEMIAERSDGKFVKHGWFGWSQTLPANRKRWTTVLGTFYYPCWIDRDGRGRVQPVQQRWRLNGPAVIYPINRVPETPLTAYTVVDILRGTLGVGPCEYILDVEGHQQQYKGRATCSNRDTLNPIYAKRQQKQKRATIERSLDEVMVFVRFIRARIDQYVDFGHELLTYLDQQRETHPELAEPIKDLEQLTRAIDGYVAKRNNRIKTPPEATKLVDDFRATMLDYDGPDALKKCKQFTNALVSIGGNQDELVGECRMAVKIVRQQAGLSAALDPRMAPISREIRKRTRAILRNPASHEAARH